MDASYDDSENDRLVTAAKPKPKPKGAAAAAAAAPKPAVMPPELGDDGFPRHDLPPADDDAVPDLTSGLGRHAAAGDGVGAGGIGSYYASGGTDGAGAGAEGGAYGDGDDGDAPDLEAQEHLARGGDATDKRDAALRRGFMRKVYGLLSVQMAATVAICAGIALYEPARAFVVGHALGVQLLTLVPLFALLYALHAYQHSYPTNTYLLAAFTGVEAVNLGVLCAVLHERGLGQIVLTAAALTTVAFVGLTLFTLQSRVDWSFLSVALFGGVWVLLIGGLLSLAFGWSAHLPFGLLGTAVFCGFVVFDTHRVMTVYGYDQYLVATIELYLDAVNLFIYIVRILIALNKKN